MNTTVRRNFGKRFCLRTTALQLGILGGTPLQEQAQEEFFYNQRFLFRTGEIFSRFFP